eukprot:736257-Rhodomonas_salina.1
MFDSTDSEVARLACGGQWQCVAVGQPETHQPRVQMYTVYPRVLNRTHGTQAGPGPRARPEFLPGEPELESRGLSSH